MHLCSYRHEFDNLPTSVRESLEDESYWSFMHGDGGDDDSGHQRVRQIHGNPPPSVRETVRRFLSAAAFGRYTRKNHQLSERLAHEAVSWCDSAWARSVAEDSHAAEEESLRSLENCESLVETQTARPPQQRRRSSGLALTLLTPQDDPHITDVERRARIAVVADAWKQELEREREEERARELGRSLGAFVRDIIAVLPDLVRAQAQVRNLFGTEDALWDLSRGEWRSTEWGALARTAEALAALPEIDRLAEILGRSRTAKEVRTARRVVRNVTLRPVGLGKSEVTGVSFGDDLTSLLPSEVALLADPETEDLFFAKLAHKEMLQLDYRRERVVPHTRERMVSQLSEVEVPRGPVIVCLDTSGSMLGEPESIARAMTLALARRLGRDRRDIHLVAFSTDTRSLTLRAGAFRLPDLCEFLGGGFHGGTDLRPALARALEVLDTHDFRNADVLVISDFRIPKIADRFISQIKEQQRRGTLFHSLTIARAPVKDPLHIFDNSWHFDVSRGARGIRPDTLTFLT